MPSNAPASSVGVCLLFPSSLAAASADDVPHKTHGPEETRQALPRVKLYLLAGRAGKGVCTVWLPWRQLHALLMALPSQEGARARSSTMPLPRVSKAVSAAALLPPATTKRDDRYLPPTLFMLVFPGKDDLSLRSRGRHPRRVQVRGPMAGCCSSRLVSRRKACDSECPRHTFCRGRAHYKTPHRSGAPR